MQPLSRLDAWCSRTRGTPILDVQPGRLRAFDDGAAARPRSTAAGNTHGRGKRSLGALPRPAARMKGPQ